MLSLKLWRLAIQDFVQGIARPHIWAMLGWQEIRQRYRRSTLGPLWLTLSTAALIAGIGPLYGRLFSQDLAQYFPYLATSLVIWMFFANLINESCLSFISAEGYIRQTKLPFSVHVLRMIWKNLIIFAHNLIIVLIVLAWFRPGTGAYLWLAPVGLLLVAINAIWLGIFLGTLCARFRDIPQIVASIVQITFFLTPVIWQEGMLGRHAPLVELNPFYHFLEILRGPLLGQLPRATTWIAVLAITALGFSTTLLFFSRFRSRIAYWV